MKNPKNTLALVVVLAITVGILFLASKQVVSPTPEVANNTEDSLATTNGNTNTGTNKGTNTNKNTNTPTPSATGLSVNTATDPVLGSILMDGKGMTLYTYSEDNLRVSNCNGECAVAWPPYVVPAGMTIKAGAGVAGMIETIIRNGGGSQVVYNGMPLYFWKNDTKAGDVTGNGANGFFVAKP